MSFFPHSGGAGTREEYRFISVAQRRGVRVTVGSVACDARIADRADQPLCFGHLGDGEVLFALQTISGKKITRVPGPWRSVWFERKIPNVVNKAGGCSRT